MQIFRSSLGINVIKYSPATISSFKINFLYCWKLPYFSTEKVSVIMESVSCKKTLICAFYPWYYLSEVSKPHIWGCFYTTNLDQSNCHVQSQKRSMFQYIFPIVISYFSTYLTQCTDLYVLHLPEDCAVIRFVLNKGCSFKTQPSCFLYT
jgi:hypothetical protein